MFKEDNYKKCPRCGNFISKTVKICPHCNTSLQSKISTGKLIFIIICSSLGTFFLISGIINLIGLNNATVNENPIDNSSISISNNISPTVETKNNTISTEKKMALESAKNYLRAMGFSKKGLISQLEYEGFTTDEATYAVNNCGANWKEEAVRVAENYLKAMPFSKQELIEQLEYEGFTNEEASYGVEIAYK